MTWRARPHAQALCNTQPDGSNALRIMGTPGKSGSLFFFSNDMRFIVKTLPKREALLLREVGDQQHRVGRGVDGCMGWW